MSARARQWIPALPALLVAAILLAVRVVQGRHGVEGHFAFEPWNIAQALVDGRGFSDPLGTPSGPTAWIPPIFPLYFSAAIAGGGLLHADPRHLLVALNTLTLGLALFATLRLCIPHWRLSSRFAFCAATLAYGLLDPDVLVSTGPLTAAACAGILAALACAWRRPESRGPWMALVVLNALVPLTHPGLGLACVCLTLGLGLSLGRRIPGERRRWARRAAVTALAGLALGTGSWVVRNAVVFRQFVAIKSNGFFELALTQLYTTDGILTVAGVVEGHPSTNPALYARFTAVGEKRFLAPYHGLAVDSVRRHPLAYVRFCLNRARNALVFSAPTWDVTWVDGRLPAHDLRLLAKAGWILPCVGVPTGLWPASPMTPEAMRTGLSGLGLTHPDAVMADWTRAQARIQSESLGGAAVIRALAWSGIPSLCVLLALLLAGDGGPGILPAATALYLLALLPNLLITHDIRHQMGFALLFALFIGALAEAVSIRRTRTPGRSAQG